MIYNSDMCSVITYAQLVVGGRHDEARLVARAVVTVARVVTLVLATAVVIGVLTPRAADCSVT